MKKAILILSLTIISVATFAQTKKDALSPCKAATPIAPKPDTAKERADAFVQLFKFTVGMVNHSPSITTLDANGDGSQNSNGGINGYLQALYNKFFPPVTPKTK